MTSPIVSPGGDADVPPPGEATVEAVQAWLGPMDEDAEVLAELSIHRPPAPTSKDPND